MRPPSMFRRLPVLAAAALMLGCSSSGSHAGASNDATAGPSEASSSGAGEESSLEDDAATDGSSDVDGAAMEMPPTVDAGACPNLPALLDGGWLNVSPPGSNYASTYSGINAVAVRSDDPAIVYAGADSNGMFRSTDCGATWTRVNTGQNATALSSGRPWTLVIDPITPGRHVHGAGVWRLRALEVDQRGRRLDQRTDAGDQRAPSTRRADHRHRHGSRRPHAPRHRVSPGSGCTYDAGADGGGIGTCLAESTDSGATWKLLEIPRPWEENSSVAILSRTTWLWGGFFGGLWQTANEGATWTEVPVNDAGSSPGLPNAYAETNYYEPYVWKDSSGRYYLPTKSWFLPGGVIRSDPGDTTRWSAIPGSPQAQFLYPTSTQLVMSSEADPHYYIASQSDPTTWKELAGPDAGNNSQGGLGVFEAYDSYHHILYSSCFNSGLWQKYVP